MQHLYSKNNLSNCNRRAFIQQGSLFLLSAGVGGSDLFAFDEKSSKPNLKIGLVTDLHYADKPPAGTRHYRESQTKLTEAGLKFEKEQPEFVVELGDFIDAADSVQTEKSYLKTINAQFSELPGKKHYVLGNHCVFTLTKQEFLEGVGQKKSYYSFDSGGYHFVVLDSCFRGDGTPYGRKNFKWTDPNIPAAELDWLKSDLKVTSKKTIVFAHQRIDVENHYGVKNSPQVRQMLEESGKVLAVFQGHSHRNDVKRINGIHYCTLVAMVEGSGTDNNGYSTLEILSDDTLKIHGFKKQASYRWR